MYLEMEKAIFIQEDKHRFLCTIQINGTLKLCHIPCSAKLSKYVPLDHNPILVIKNQTPNCRTDYKLVAIKYNNEWIMVNFSLVNLLIKEQLSSTLEFQLEKKISSSYKADIVYQSNVKGSVPTLIECKGVISTEETALLPNHSGERATRQLHFFCNSLEKKSFSVEYCIALMNIGIKSLKLNIKNDEYCKLFKKCIRLGMTVKLYQVIVENNCIYLQEQPHMTVLQ